MRYLCQVPSFLKLPTFHSTTALQRKLSFGALDFSPLRHSPAFTRQEYYTKISPERSGEILANVNRGEAAELQKGRTPLYMFYLYERLLSRGVRLGRTSLFLDAI